MKNEIGKFLPLRFVRISLALLAPTFTTRLLSRTTKITKGQLFSVDGALIWTLEAGPNCCKISLSWRALNEDVNLDLYIFNLLAPFSLYNKENTPGVCGNKGKHCKTISFLYAYFILFYLESVVGRQYSSYSRWLLLTFRANVSPLFVFKAATEVTPINNKLSQIYIWKGQQLVTVI